MTVRWTFDDEDGEIFTFPINPDSMGPVAKSAPRSAVFATGFFDERVRTLVGKPAPRDFTFGGVIRSEAFYDALSLWAKKDRAIVVTDHIGRQFRVFLDAFTPTDRKPNPNTPWRLRYTMKGTLLEGLT